MIDRRRLLSAAGLLLALAAPGAARAATAGASGVPGVLVLPFENTAEDPSLAWLSTGLALHTGEDLRGFGCAVVDDEDRAVLLEGNGIPAGASLTLASALELGRKMRSRPSGIRPDHLVLGRFTVQEGQVTLTSRVIELATERAHPWITRQGRLTDLIEVHQSLVEALARDADLRPNGRAAKHRGKDSDPPLLAFETYCRAMAETDSRKRLGLLRKALQEFPGYPTAAFQAATLMARSDRWDEAAEALGKASSDAHPYEAEFHQLASQAALQRKDATTAAAEARQALGYSDTARGHALLGRAVLALGDRGTAQAELEASQALDPSDPDADDLKKLLKQEAKPAGRTP